ncbi:RdgB/HAM1 family non-canonical purine NTP pyrophosphatase [Adlercreutzia aquisgranensis]|uniref:RdgB/HAM1 family non-canonical purine NTP pyrophosphatase n=1 Tax=Adlercreutzia aquisgranensis TaxID=2941323 RepID=UPI00203EF2BA|nr:RdgB/HAM1 family non-canonical purine NTP pyrophosphatase [Adlercreutzia aquisgranensis]
MKTVIIASNNAHKVEEIAEALDFPGWCFQTLRQAGIASDPAEDADTFLGNALIKARSAFAVAREAGLRAAVLADDSGLEVDALGGQPGVYSARYAGADGDDAANNSKLLAELRDVPDERRSARFVCTLAFVDEDGSEITARGTVEGRIGHELRGEGGFGYDPLFFPDAYEGKLSFGQVPAQDKHAVSHRGNALRQLRELLGA